MIESALLIQPSQNLALGRDYITSIPASEVYPDTKGRLLTDGKRASDTDPHQGWIGFEYGEPAITLDLGKICQIHSVKISYLFLPQDGIQLPLRSLLKLSKDGRSWSSVGHSDSSQDHDMKIDVPNDEEPARYVRIEIERNQWFF